MTGAIVSLMSNIGRITDSSDGDDLAHLEEEEMAARAYHPDCETCGKKVCLTGERGISDDCPDSALGTRRGKFAVHLGECLNVLEMLGAQGERGTLLLGVEL